MASNKTTGLLGASYESSSGKYRAQIMCKGKKITIGRFDTKEQAHNAYLEAKRIMHEGCSI